MNLSPNYGLPHKQSTKFSQKDNHEELDFSKLKYEDQVLSQELRSLVHIDLYRSNPNYKAFLLNLLLNCELSQDWSTALHFLEEDFLRKVVSIEDSN